MMNPDNPDNNPNNPDTQVNVSDSLPWVAGSMIWTLQDYFGEPAHLPWPYVSSSFGAVDIAGFPKANARWFQAWWLQTDFPLSAASRPPLPQEDMVYLVENNEAPAADAPAGYTPTYHVYTNAHSVELFINDASQGRQLNDEWMGWLDWNVSAWVAGNVSAVAYDAQGNVVAVDTRITASQPAKLVLTLDAPHENSGTGNKVLLDGHDVALVRATIVDAQGNPALNANHNITFNVQSGPGRVLGVGNGEPTDHSPNQVNWRLAYQSLARAVVKVTVDASHDQDIRALIREIDVETGKSTVQVADPSVPYDMQPIVVSASAPGLGSATLEIQVSSDEAQDGVLAVARASLHLPISLD